MTNLTPWQRLIMGIVGFVIIFWLLGLITPVIEFNLLWWMPRLYLVFWLLLLTVHLSFALGVARDADTLKTTGRGAFFVGPMVWGIMTFIGGLIVVFIYWLMHHSTLRRV